MKKTKKAKKAAKRSRPVVRQDSKALIIREKDFIEESRDKKVALVKGPLSPQQVLKIFQRTPPQHIHQRPGRGAQTFDYVTGVYVRKILNYVFGWLWDFEIIESGVERVGDKPTEIWVKGKLTINQRNPKTGEITPVIVKMQFGGAEVKYLKTNPKYPVSLANDRKAAATDALKKCASELGVASDVYGKNEFKDLAPQREVHVVDDKGDVINGHEVNQPRPAGSPEMLQKVIFDIKREMLSRRALNAEAQVKLFNKLTGYKIRRFEELTLESAQEALLHLINPKK